MSTLQKDTYADCVQFKRTKPDRSKFHPKLVEEAVGKDFNTLPSFEKSLFDYVYREHYSMTTNELLNCRWKKYKQNIEQRQFAPFVFPDKRDLHFYNGGIRFLTDPEISIFRKTNYRQKLKPGPGVDAYGQMPIPHELLMKRGRIELEKKRRPSIEEKKAVKMAKKGKKK